MPTIQDFLFLLQDLIPEGLAEDWDNVGLLAGHPQSTIRRILVALDPARALVDQAYAGGCDLILTHHPAIFRPIKALRDDTPTGSFLAAAIRRNIAVIACHTNLDSAIGGVSDTLASALGLSDIRPLVPNAKAGNTGIGLGRIGSYTEAMTAEDFLSRVRQACAPPWILEAGRRPRAIRTAAVCGGSCADFAELALGLGAEVFLTSEIKHAVARWAEEAGLWLLDGGHFATEYCALPVFIQRLRQEMSQRGWEMSVQLAEQAPPLKLI